MSLENEILADLHELPRRPGLHLRERMSWFREQWRHSENPAEEAEIS